MAADRMTLERLTVILDAYGADPRRWPAAERDAGLALLEGSADARARREAAAGLDVLLDGVSPVRPSPELSARVLATAPQAGGGPPAVRGRPLRTRIVVGAAALAAAASLALWLGRDPGGAIPALDAAALAQLDAYDTPTDILLADDDPDLEETVPTFGCDDPTFPCAENGSASPRPSAAHALPTKEMRA